jgi:heat shock protein HslJ
VVAVVPALLVAVTACGDDGDDGTGSTTRPGAPGKALEGTDWVLEDVSELAPGASGTVTALFDGGTVTGESACNQYRAPYRVDGSRLTVGPEIAGTAMACGPGPTAAERAYTTRLAEVASYTVEDEQLRLAGRDGETLLTFGAADASGILGTWDVTGYYTGTAVQSPRSDSSLTADFGAEEISGNGGCNRFSGPVRIDGDAITIGPLASTLVACADPALTTQEQQYLHALELATRFAATGDRLDLFRADGGIAVSFQRLDGAT